MDDHQRRVWSRMIDYLDDYNHGVIDLATLGPSLKGLVSASDPQDEALVSAFWDHYMEIEMELELRTEGWAPAGAASDDRLSQALEQYRTWVQEVMARTDDQRT